MGHTPIHREEKRKRESPCMSRKIWAAPINLSLHRSTSHLFREKRGHNYLISMPEKKSHCLMSRKYGPLPLICLSVDALATCSEKKVELSHHLGREKKSCCTMYRKIWVALIDLFLHLTIDRRRRVILIM
jgi:hypothetical protein